MKPNTLTRKHVHQMC